jgi:hypothetical protein
LCEEIHPSIYKVSSFALRGLRGLKSPKKIAQKERERERESERERARETSLVAIE